MSLKNRIREIIAIIEESNVNEVEISSWWGRKIRVVKNASGGPLAGSNPATGPVPAAGPAAPAAEESPAAGDGSHTIHSPIVGTFYGSASPETPAFIQVGDRISSGQTICIIEAMKIMNEIESDVDGIVTEILVENASPVEFNQPLVIVRPG